MALIKSIKKTVPTIGKNVFLADNAVIIGDVTIGENCSVWFNTVLRGDVNAIRIGNRVNIQDGAIIHTLYEKSITEIGDDVSIGHHAVIHGAKIENGALIGIGSIILDHVIIGEGSLIAAGSVVLGGTKIKPNSIYGGTPAVYIKKVTPKQYIEINKTIAKNYLIYSSWYN